MSYQEGLAESLAMFPHVPVMPGWLSEWPQTVPHTHLRAHETVLVLVCRLLLEKKKTRLPSPASQQYLVYRLLLEHEQNANQTYVILLQSIHPRVNDTIRDRV